MKREIAPSILSANFINLKKDLDVLYDNGIKYIHLDVMDGNFVPNISFGTPVYSFDNYSIDNSSKMVIFNINKNDISNHISNYILLLMLLLMMIMNY